MTKRHDFAGYATKAGLKCSDGRTIMPDAFKHMDGKQVPLVWQHGHGDSSNVLGHAILEARPDGVYAYGYFNETPQGQNAKALVQHEDIRSLSIYANKLVERSKQVFHGFIREVSLVLSGANPGALIDFVAVAHDDGTTDILDDEAIIYTGLELVHSDEGDSNDDAEVVVEEEASETVEHAEDGDDETVEDVYNSLTEKQKNVVHYMIGAALAEVTKDNDDAAEQSATTTDDNAEHSATTTDDNDIIEHEEGQEMNVFDQDKTDDTETHTLSHDDVAGIVQSAARLGSLKEAVEEYALQHGITNIDVLFPDAQNLTGAPEWDARRMEWVKGVLDGVNKSPFSRIKTLSADITLEEARAKGYVKGALKKEEFFGVTKRTTSPTTVYKKQKLDRDDILDITDFDVVAWMKGEMRLMLDEELARAILIGDGRDVAHEDKIKDPGGASEGSGIRSILNDHELYVTTVNVNIDDANSSYEEVVESVMRARRFYKGSGSPTFYTTYAVITEMLLAKDGFGRRLWNSMDELKKALMVKDIVEVEVMEDEPDVLGIMVNLRDYNVGADKGGRLGMFEDFDIDYNQHKYLLETRVSGALTKIKSALVVKKVAGTLVLVAPAEPTYDDAAETVTIVDQTGVLYFNAADDSAMNAAGSPYAVPVDGSLTVYATPDTGYYFATNAEDSWTYEYTA